MAAEKSSARDSPMSVKKFDDLLRFCCLNSSCLRINTTFIFMSSSWDEFILLWQNSKTDVSVGFRPPCLCPWKLTEVVTKTTTKDPKPRKLRPRKLTPTIFPQLVKQWKMMGLSFQGLSFHDNHPTSRNVCNSVSIKRVLPTVEHGLQTGYKTRTRY